MLPLKVLTWSCSPAAPVAAAAPPSSAPSPARRHPVTTPERAQVRALSESRSRREPKAPKEAPKEAPRAPRETREAEDLAEPQDREERDELPAAVDHMQEVPAPLAETLKTMQQACTNCAASYICAGIPNPHESCRQSHLEIMMRTVQLLATALVVKRPHSECSR